MSSYESAACGIIDMAIAERSFFLVGVIVFVQGEDVDNVAVDEIMIS